MRVLLYSETMGNEKPIYASAILTVSEVETLNKWMELPSPVSGNLTARMEAIVNINNGETLTTVAQGSGF